MCTDIHGGHETVVRGEWDSLWTSPRDGEHEGWVLAVDNLVDECEVVRVLRGPVDRLGALSYAYYQLLRYQEKGNRK